MITNRLMIDWSIPFRWPRPAGVFLCCRRCCCYFRVPFYNYYFFFFSSPRLLWKTLSVGSPVDGGFLISDFFFPFIFLPFFISPPSDQKRWPGRHSAIHHVASPNRRLFFSFFFFEILDPFASETPKRKSILGPASLNGNSDIIDPIDNRRSFSLALFIPLSFSFFLFSFFLLGWRQGRGRGSSRLHQFDQTVVFFLLTTRPPRWIIVDLIRTVSV